MTERPQENWGAAEAYERYVGRWSRPVARSFLDWLNVPAGAVWTDVGCGTGALSGSILKWCAPLSVVGIDRAAGFVAAAERLIPDARARFQIGDAAHLPLETACSGAAVSGLVLNFVNDPAAMVREMVRVTRPGGWVAAYVWDYAGGMQMMSHFWEAAVALRPDDAELGEARRFPLCQPEPLAALWRGAGLSAVSVRATDSQAVFQDFADYWTPFLGGQGPAPTYLASLGAGAQAHIREALRARLVPGPDGTINLGARAWAVKGLVAG